MPARSAPGRPPSHGPFTTRILGVAGCAEWGNFTAVINNAKTACEVSGHAAADHFVNVNKMVDLGSGSQREVDDLMLTDS